jgi:uncharacterized coiled-coil DUF342 family protein
MKKKILKVEELGDINDRRKSLTREINILTNERSQKRDQAKRLTSEIRKLKRRLSTLSKKIGK